MFLRRLGTSTSAALRRGANEGDLLAALRAEIAHELPSSSPPSQEIPNFATVTDAPRAQDVLLRHRGAAGEEVLVSALLAPLRFQGEDPLPRDALMKVFVSKAGAKPVLRFDCRVSADGGGGGGGGGTDYDITSVCYHSFPGDAGERQYEGPQFRALDPQLQAALKEYLLARGVNSLLSSLLLQHLLQKEHFQYVSWLKTLEEMFAKDQ